jgi:transcriptional regulator with GAF, ATPase, and Fis domain/tetratricopeptide (TPR) repeat protein
MDELHGSEPSGREGKEHKGHSISTSLEDLGNFCLASGEFTTAIEYFNKLLALTGSSSQDRVLRASLLRRLATCYLKIGKCDHALELLDKAFVLVSEGEDPVELARIIGERGWVHFKRGEYDLSSADLESGLDILLGDERGREIGNAYNRLGGIAARKGDNEKAFDLLRTALSAARLTKDRELQGTVLNNLGLTCKNLGRWAESRKCFEEALEIADEIGQHLQKALRLNNLGIIYSKMGMLKKAHRCWSQSLETLTRIGNRGEIVSVCLSLGQYHLIYRDFERAEGYFVRALKESSDNGVARDSALSLEYMGDLHMACDRVDEARVCYREALEIAEEIAPHGDVVTEAKRKLADVEVQCGNYEAGMELAFDACRVASGMKDIFEAACSLRSKACAEFQLGEWERARADFAEAISRLSSLGEKRELAKTYLVAGELLSVQPSSAGLALDYLGSALAIFEDIGMNYEAGLSALWLGRVAATKGDVERCHGLLGKVMRIFGDHVPEDVLQEISKIEREADEQVSTLSVSEANDLAGFNTVVDQILSARGETGKLDVVLDACLAKTTAERGVILMNRNGGFKSLAARAMDDEVISELKPVIAEMLMIAESSGRPFVSAGIDRDGRLSGCGVDGLPSVAAICVPLTVSGAGLGSVYLDSRPEGKPFTRDDVEFVVALMGIAKSVLSEAQLGKYMEEARFLRSRLKKSAAVEGIITQNRRMLEILEAVGLVNRASTTVLIEGETGTGKEMLARAIHATGDRAGRPFVTIDCSALANEILESELFGHVKGAFTDAKVNKQGLFETADGGTVFLDEIDKTSRKFQERLLQVVDKREFKPVGSTVSRKVDFRLICATNRDLAQRVEGGHFLEDLYYRLKVISMRLPPLRERRDDIPLLAEHFLGMYSNGMGKSVIGFSAQAMDVLVSYTWPGNVRQMEHEIERAVTFATEGELITPDLFSEDLTGWGSVVATDTKKPLTDAVEQVEKQMIREAIRRSGGNKTRAAKSLGISRRGLLNKLQRYHMQV